MLQGKCSQALMAGFESMCAQHTTPHRATTCPKRAECSEDAAEGKQFPHNAPLDTRRATPACVSFMNGHIVWLRPERSYGFVRPVDGGGDLVFDIDATTHARLGAVAPGMAVHFMVNHGGTAPLAVILGAGHLDDDIL